MRGHRGNCCLPVYFLFPPTVLMPLHQSWSRLTGQSQVLLPSLERARGDGLWACSSRSWPTLQLKLSACNWLRTASTRGHHVRSSMAVLQKLVCVALSPDPSAILSFPCCFLPYLLLSLGLDSLFLPFLILSNFLYY